MADAEMNKNSSTPGTSLEAVEALEASLAESMQAREASLSLGMKVRAAALVIVLLYFSFLYSLVAGFTSDQAVDMARGHLDTQLPQLKKETVDHMKATAPEVVSTYTQNLLSSIPTIRQHLEDELLANTGSVIGDLQSGLNEVFTQMLQESKTELDKMGSDKSTVEKLDRLSKQMRIKFNEESRAAVDHLSGQFSSSMQKVIVEVQRLQANKGLNAKEKHQREMLRVWSKLMQIKMKDVNKQVHEETQHLTR